MPPSYALPSSSVYPVDPGTFHNDYTATLAADAALHMLTFILRHPPSILLIPDHFVTIITARWQLMPPSYALISSSVYPVDPRTIRNDYTAMLAADAAFIDIAFILRLSC
jgi:hypothetical protein